MHEIFSRKEIFLRNFSSRFPVSTYSASEAPHIQDNFFTILYAPYDSSLSILTSNVPALVLIFSRLSSWIKGYVMCGILHIIGNRKSSKFFFGIYPFVVVKDTVNFTWDRVRKGTDCLGHTGASCKDKLHRRTFALERSMPAILRGYRRIRKFFDDFFAFSNLS